MQPWCAQWLHKFYPNFLRLWAAKWLHTDKGFYHLRSESLALVFISLTGFSFFFVWLPSVFPKTFFLHFFLWLCQPLQWFVELAQCYVADHMFFSHWFNWLALLWDLIRCFFVLNISRHTSIILSFPLSRYAVKV